MPGTLTTMQCPKCGQSVLASAPACQFCGTILNVAPRGRAAFMAPADDRKTWQEIVYYILAVVWVLWGAYYIAMGIGLIPSVWTESKFWSASKGGAFIGTIGGVYLFVGIGLLFEQGWIQFITKIMCWLGIGLTIINLPFVLFARHPLVPLLMSVVQMALYGLQLHVIAAVGDV